MFLENEDEFGWEWNRGHWDIGDFLMAILHLSEKAELYDWDTGTLGHVCWSAVQGFSPTFFG